MRRDILERMRILKKDEIKINYSKLAKQYGCDYRTIRKYFKEDIDQLVQTRQIKPSLLDNYKEIINEKLEIGCTATAIHGFIKKKGFKGSYSIVKRYCFRENKKQLKKATIRFETTPGEQAQVDWKESKTLISKHGEVFTFNIFLVLLGNSRYKYLELTLDRKQSTVFQALTNSFLFFEGVPKEILFDNMKTVVDHSKSTYDKAVINSTFYEYSKDIGFKAVLCRAYRPQTKGKVEALAKVMNRLDVYNNEFETIDELDEIIRELNVELNNEVSQATGSKPIDLFKNEKKYLNKLPRHDVLEGFRTKPITRTVTKESMITYNKSKYSVPTKYIGKTLTVIPKGNTLYLHYNKELIKSHLISQQKFNYHNDDIKDILKSDVFSHKTDDEIESFIEDNMSMYDKLGGE